MGAPMMDTTNAAPSTSAGPLPSSAVPTTAKSNGETDPVSLEETYTSLIQEYLQVMCLENATFLAERLVATCQDSANAKYLLALCHYRSGAPKRASMILEDVRTTTPSTDYLLAKCCYDLEYFGRAEEALLKQARSDFMFVENAGTTSMDDWILETTPCPVPNGAAGLNLLGNVCRRSNRKQRAMKYYHMSLQLDPLMWTSYEALCELGATDIDPTTIFGVRPRQIDDLQAQLQKPQENGAALPLQEKSMLSPSLHFAQMGRHGTPLDSSSIKPLQPMDLGTPSSIGSGVPKTSLFQTAQKQKVTPNQLQFDTPNLTPIPHQQDASFVGGGGGAALQTSFFAVSHNPNTVRRAKHVAARMYYAPTPETPEYWNSRSAQQHSTSRFLRGRSASFAGIEISDTPLRRGGRPSEVSTTRRPRALFHSENKTSNNQLEEEEEEEDDEIVLNRSSRTEDEPMQSDAVQKSLESPDIVKQAAVTTKEALVMDEAVLLDRHGGVEKILELCCLMGAGYWRLCQYRCREALQLFQTLPHVQHNSGWVLHQEGRAYFEMADYRNAQRSLELMQTVEPHRMKGLELLSTVLWQLKKEVDIAHLAQKAVDFDRLCPEAWCVVGNCFSLQKEHETALVFFSRALQLNSSFTYVHTLSGYEYMANEDFEKAIACFRNAIRADERHYNAWYGIGAIYHRQEKYDLAEYHFHRAVSINPQSSVLRCNLGMSQYSNGKPLQALDTLAEAFRLDPHNPQARFQRATIYVTLNRSEEALKDLEKVRDAAPREATVHFAMGKVLKRLGRPDQAMKCFLTALDLDPKDNQLIKSAMDKLDEPDVDEEVAAF